MRENHKNVKARG